VKAFRVLLGDQVLVDVPGVPGGQVAISFQPGVLSRTIIITSELRVARELVETQFMTAHLPQSDQPEDRMKVIEPVQDMPKSSWLTEKEVCRVTGLTTCDLTRLSHHLDKQRSTKCVNPSGVLYSRLSVERLMRLYKLPHKRFYPMPPDLSNEEKWSTVGGQSFQKPDEDATDPDVAGQAPGEAEEEA
jgi:hypothetical protein